MPLELWVGGGGLWGSLGEFRGPYGGAGRHRAGCGVPGSHGEVPGVMGGLWPCGAMGGPGGCEGYEGLWGPAVIWVAPQRAAGIP